MKKCNFGCPTHSDAIRKKHVFFSQKKKTRSEKNCFFTSLPTHNYKLGASRTLTCLWFFFIKRDLISVLTCLWFFFIKRDLISVLTCLWFFFIKRDLISVLTCRWYRRPHRKCVPHDWSHRPSCCQHRPPACPGICSPDCTAERRISKFSSAKGTTWIYILYTDWFYAFGRLQKKPKFIQYSCIQFTGHWAQYIYNCFLLDIYNTIK